MEENELFYGTEFNYKEFQLGNKTNTNQREMVDNLDEKKTRNTNYLYQKL